MCQSVWPRQSGTAELPGVTMLEHTASLLPDQVRN
jgi:hypothetical protein